MQRNGAYMLGMMLLASAPVTAQRAVPREPIIDMHLTREQKRDIFYNNAARFLRLPPSNPVQ